MTLDVLIESVLFFKGNPLKIAKLAEILGVDEEGVEEALEILRSRLEGRGIILVRKDDEVMLGTNPKSSELLEGLQKEELSREIGKAGLETLAIILYKGPVAKSEIDYIRGVNSQFILRNLLIRGLIEKCQNNEKTRSFCYRPAFGLISHLGLGQVSELPEYSIARDSLAQAVDDLSKGENL